MIKIRKTCLMPLAAAVVFCALAAACGCRKKAPVHTSRASDPKYVAELKTLAKDQKAVAASRAKLRDEMDELRHKAAANLAGAATSAQIDYELDAYPAKYPRWRELKAQDAALESQMKDKLAQARASVRERIIQERADQEAVKAGKAQAAKK